MWWWAVFSVEWRKSGFLAGDGELASADGELASVDGELASVDGELASADGELASIDGALASADGELASADGELASIDGELASADGTVVFGLGRIIFRIGEVGADIVYDVLKGVIKSGTKPEGSEANGLANVVTASLRETTACFASPTFTMKDGDESRFSRWLLRAGAVRCIFAFSSASELGIPFELHSCQTSKSSHLATLRTPTTRSCFTRSQKTRFHRDGGGLSISCRTSKH